MANLVTTPSWREADPHRIDAELAALWRDLARDTPINRALLSNILVFSEQRESGLDPGSLEPLLEEVVCRHPSRVIVLRHRLDRGEACAPVAARIGVLTFGDNQTRYGVEQIVVRSACADASLPSIVGRLLVGDVPTSIWWTEDLSQVAPIPSLVTMGCQFVYDSRCWRDFPRGVLALQGLLDTVDLADLNWTRVAGLRRELREDRGVLRDRRQISLQVRHGRSEAAGAWLLIGWLDTRLAPDSTFTLSIDGTAPDNTLSVSIGPTTRQILLAGSTQAGQADALVAELRSLGRDTDLHDALRALIRRFSSRA